MTDIDSAELERMVRHRCRQLGRSETWPIRTEKPLGKLARGERVEGEIVRIDGRRAVRHAVTFSRTAGDPVTYEVVVPDFPSDYELLSLVAGSFQYWLFEPLRLTINRRSTSESPSYRFAADDQEPLSLACLDEDEYVPLQLAGKTSSKVGNEHVTAAINLTYGEVRITGKLPEGRDLDFLVTEVRADGETAQVRVVSLSATDHDAVARGKTRFDLGDPKLQGDFELRVRPLEHGDLFLLDPDQCTEFLGRVEIEALPVTRIANVLTARSSLVSTDSLAIVNGFALRVSRS